MSTYLLMANCDADGQSKTDTSLSALDSSRWPSSLREISFLSAHLILAPFGLAQLARSCSLRFVSSPPSPPATRTKILAASPYTSPEARYASQHGPSPSPSPSSYLSVHIIFSLCLSTLHFLSVTSVLVSSLVYLPFVELYWSTQTRGTDSTWSCTKSPPERVSD